MSTNNGKLHGVLASFSVGCISGSKRDPTITREVLEEKHAADDSGAWTNRLFPTSVCGKDHALNKLRRHLCAMRHYHYDSTFVYEDTLWRILPEKRITTYKEVVDVQGKAQADELVTQLAEDLPLLIEMAKMGRGAAFRASDYPSSEDVRSKFHYSVDYRPIPDASALNAEMFQDAINKLNVMHEQRLAEANQTLLQRFMTPFQLLAEQLKDPTKRKMTPVIEAISRIAEEIPTLDLSGNQDLITLANQVRETMTQIQPDVLRQDKQMQDMLAQFANHSIASLQRFSNSVGVRKFA